MSYQSLFNIDNAGDVKFDNSAGQPTINDDAIFASTDGKTIKKGAAGGGGDFSTNTSSSTTDNAVTFADGGGKLGKDSGVIILKPNASSSFIDTLPGTPYTGTDNFGIGPGALALITSGTHNTGIGRIAGDRITIGDNNCFIGYLTQTGIGGANSQNRIGIGATVSCNHDDCIIIAANELGTSTTQPGMCKLGNSALTRLILGDAVIYDNTAFSTTRHTLGAAPPAVALTGTTNLFAGSNSGLALTSGGGNNAFGSNSLTALTTGAQNTAFGNNALINLITGGNNSAFGADALQVCTSSDCVGFGNNAGDSVSTGANNTCIGANSDAAATLANQTALGFGAIADAANQMMLGNADLTQIVPNAGATCDLGSVAKPFDTLYVATSVLPDIASGAALGTQSTAFASIVGDDISAEIFTVRKSGGGLDVTAGVATLIAGNVTVNTDAVIAGGANPSLIFLTRTGVVGAGQGFLRVAGQISATSFDIFSSNASDNADINWWLINTVA